MHAKAQTTAGVVLINVVCMYVYDNQLVANDPRNRSTEFIMVHLTMIPETPGGLLSPRMVSSSAFCPSGSTMGPQLGAVTSSSSEPLPLYRDLGMPVTSTSSPITTN